MTLLLLLFLGSGSATAAHAAARVHVDDQTHAPSPAPAPSLELELHYNVSNVNNGRPQSQWVVQLAASTEDLRACGTLCAAYDNAANGVHLRRCQSFTRLAATPGPCYGHLDPQWLPLSGVSGGATPATVADSGLVLRPCASDFDCSYNGRCTSSSTSSTSTSASVCACSQGWTGRRCQTLDLLPVDRAKYGFSPQDSRGQNLSSWGGSVLSHNGVWHMWAARMENYCGIGQGMNGYCWLRMVPALVLISACVQRSFVICGGCVWIVIARICCRLCFRPGTYPVGCNAFGAH